jgi:uncharacterized protein with von Willebrand factor type A (vWA) domain
MLLNLFVALRAAQVPVTLREYLTLLEGLDRDLACQSVDQFYFLARTTLVKDERNFDKFDRVFGHVFSGVVGPETPEPPTIPAEWLRKLAEKYLSEAERQQLQALGFAQLMALLNKRLREQTGRHQGGSKWIGTAGPSPFGAFGYHPDGIRMGQAENRSFRAVKIWEKREFKDLDADTALAGRAMKLALRRLRKFARSGALKELDLDDTIRSTAHRGYLDVKLRAERRNAVKVLLLLDVGGSMDWHIREAEELFAAARSEFKHLEYFYFHNCPYEGLWKDNRRRHVERTPTWDVLRTFPRDYKLIMVGDASMSPYEIELAGGSVEHLNEEPGAVWIDRLTRAYPASIWLNPVPEPRWSAIPSIAMIRHLINLRMYPLTLEGLDAGMRQLLR